MSRQLVLVTGITGFIAGHVTERLIERGYRVRGTVRSTKYQQLSKQTIPGLEFTEVNDLATDDLTQALKGVSVVMHVAAPLPGKADAAGSIKTAVEGTLNVIRQAEKAGITKIVVTSTFGNMFPPSLETAYSGVKLTDSDWGVTTKEEVIANAANPFYVYFGSKNLAERALWDFVAQHPHLDVTSINPGFVYGPYAKILPAPGSQGELGSNIFNWMLLNGSFPPAGMAPPWVVDVRDIAKAHVAAIKLPRFSPANTKRFLVNGSNFEWSEAAEAVRKAVPEITTLPAASAYGGIPGPAAILDSSRAKKELQLGEFIPPAQTFIDTLKDLNRLRSEWAAKSQQLVLVTGITGFIAGHVTERLIEQGYRVRGTVRSTKYQKLSQQNIPGLEFTEVNDLATDDLTEALKGVSVVMHVAAPLPGKADAAGSIKTAVDGTLNVVRQAEKAGITKIVVTSTFGNMFPPSLETAYSGVTLTDSDWGVTTKEQVIANAANPFYVYFGSKNLAERALWDFVAKHPHLDVTSINPGFVYGPYAKILPAPGSDGELGSNVFNWMLLNGSYPPAGMAPPWVVDVRDIAKAHVAAIKLAPYSPANTKRFLVNGSNFEWSEAAEAVRKAVPEITTLPAASAYGGIPGPAAILDSSRAKKELGLDDFIPPAQTFIDTLKDLNRLRSEWAAKAAEKSSPQLVLVTGITGFIAGHVTERLIEQGYRVRGTVRSTKYQKLSKEKIAGLEFTEVNDLATDDLTEALKGVSVVMHVAAPLPGKADAAGSIKTAVDGTLNVVRQAEKAGITKVVVTSTFGNMFPPSLETAYSGVKLTDSDWGVTTKEEVIANAANPFYVYFGSKNLAERALWDFVAEHPHLDVASINPGFVYGPYAKILPAPGSDSELGSNVFNWMLLNGSYPPAAMAPPWVVDVRDIAKAHVAAIKLAPYSPANTKRFLVNGSNFEWSEAAEAVRKAVPEIKTLPEASAYGGIPGPAAILDSSRAKKELGLDDFIPPAQTFIDTLKDLNRLRSEWAANAPAKLSEEPKQPAKKFSKLRAKIRQIFVRKLRV